jgi:ribosomal protein L24E
MSKCSLCSQPVSVSFFSKTAELRVGSEIFYFCDRTCREVYKTRNNLETPDHRP